MMGLPPELIALAERLAGLSHEERAAAIAKLAPSQQHAILVAIMAQPMLKAAIGATFKLTARQTEAKALLDDPDILHILMFGGSRSGKSALAVRTIIERAIKAPGSRHLLARHRFNHAKNSLWFDTLPKTLKLCFPTLSVKWDKADFFVELENGSQVWLGGLDSDERAETILGTEYATALLEECSQIGWAEAEMVGTRVAQQCGLPLKLIYCENPPLVSHWTHRLFIEKRSPESPYKPLTHREQYAAIQINPEHNAENLAPVYLEGLRSGSARQKLRFYDGRFGDAGETALWTLETIERNRVPKAPQLQRVGVAIDPSGTKGGDGRDHVGIIVGGLGLDGSVYLLEDASVQAPPAVWGKVVMGCVERYDAEFVCIETNFGGAMATAVVQAAAADAGRRVPIHEVTASRGKTVRAEPVSQLYEQGRVHHVGALTALEDQLVSFSTVGYLGDGSPDRADAAIWLVTDFFPRVMREARDAAGESAGAARRRRERPTHAQMGYSSMKRWGRERPASSDRPPGKPYA
jgi:predicted phage terminase large subunit-like protein